MDNIAYAKVSKVIRVRMPIVPVLERKGASADIVASEQGSVAMI